MWMRVLLFVVHVCMLRECEGDGNAGVVMVSVGHEYVGGARGSGILSRDERGMRGDGGMCLTRGRVDKRIGFWLYQCCGNSVLSCCKLSISASYYVFVYGIYRKSRPVCVWLSDLDLSRHHPLL